MKDLPKSPCVGENVVWFPHGDTNQTPFAATVTARINDECITVFTLSPTGRREPMLNIRHVDHPYHENHPIPLKRWGAWDLVGEHEKREEKKKQLQEEKRQEALELAEKNVHVDVELMHNPDDDEMVIIRFSRELGDVPGRAQLVADKIGAGMTHQRVNAVLRKYPHFLSGPLPEDLVEVPN